MNDYKEHNKKILNQIKNNYPDLIIHDETNLEKLNSSSYIILESKYGLYKSNVYNLLNNYKPTIQSALNKTEHFIKQSIEIYGNNYDYSKSIYKDSKKIIEIICTIENHGSFFKSPDKHLNAKQGCPICSAIRKSNEVFKEQAKKVHKNIYDYSLVLYKHNRIKVKIICLIHGEFEQDPHLHLQGHGCQKCGKENQKIGSGFSKSTFKKQCIKNNNGLGIFYILKCFNENEMFYKLRNNF